MIHKSSQVEGCCVRMEGLTITGDVSLRNHTKLSPVSPHEAILIEPEVAPTAVHASGCELRGCWSLNGLSRCESCC